MDAGPEGREAPRAGGSGPATRRSPRNVPLAGEARWKLETAAKKQTVTMTIGQVLALRLARDALSFLDGTHLVGDLDAVTKKLAVGLPPERSRLVEALPGKVAVVHHGPKSYTHRLDVLNDLLSALLWEQLVEVWYRRPRGKAQRQVLEPLTLLQYREALYLIAHSRTRKARLTFAVDRIEKSRWLKGERFERPADYSPETFIDGSFGLIGGPAADVQIEFDAAQAPFVRERRWHPTQVFKELAGGRLRLSMKVSGLEDVARWLLGHTGTFEVVAPPELRKRARDAAKKAAALNRG